MMSSFATQRPTYTGALRLSAARGMRARPVARALRRTMSIRADAAAPAALLAAAAKTKDAASGEALFDALRALETLKEKQVTLCPPCSICPVCLSYLTSLEHPAFGEG
jgi:hypothetical protein